MVFTKNQARFSLSENNYESPEMFLSLFGTISASKFLQDEKHMNSAMIFLSINFYFRRGVFGAGAKNK